jgi:putative ubiquitin-RnfH superfamily antitoxin RatB of RatAB toxin-antitoxin module
MKIVVAFSPQAREVREWLVEMPMGSTAQDAVSASGVFEVFPELSCKPISLGVWGRKCRLDRVLLEDDRVEIYRPLRVDPKVARRERFSSQGARSAGLFATRRAGSKAGY